MNEETADKIEEKLLEISSLICVLKNALNNPDQLTQDTAHYGKYVSMIESKLNRIYDEFYK